MENSLVVKANDLVQARYELSLLEQKIILYAVSKLDRETSKFNIISLSVAEFTDCLDGSLIRYKEIKEVVMKLMDKKLYINTDKDELVAHWVSAIRYTHGTGIVELEFSEMLIPYLLQLKNRFTKYYLKNIIHLKNKYSIRVYELLKEFQGLEKRNFDLEEFKRILMIEDKYSEFKDFNKWILKPTMQEINQHTDLEISYEKVTRGRKVIGINYTIASKEDASYVEYLNNTYNMSELKSRMGLDKENLNSKQIIELYTIATEKTQDEVDPFLYAQLNYKHMIKNGTARNKFAYMKKALENDYAKAFAQLKYNHIIEY